MKIPTPAQLYALGATEQEILAHGDECHKFVKDLKAHKEAGKTKKQEKKEPENKE